MYYYKNIAIILLMSLWVRAEVFGMHSEKAHKLSITGPLHRRELGDRLTWADKGNIERMVALRNRRKKQFESIYNQVELAQFCLDNPAYLRDACLVICARRNSKLDFETFFFHILMRALIVRFVENSVPLRKVSIDALTILVKDYGVSVNVKAKLAPDTEITTPLHEVVLYRDVEIAQKLLEWGADKDIQDHKRRTPYQVLQDKINSESGSNKTALVQDLEEQLSKLLLTNSGL